MGKILERWSRAIDEMKFYENQLNEAQKTSVFQEMIKNRAPKILDPSTQLFSPTKQNVVVKKRVSRRTTKV